MKTAEIRAPRCRPARGARIKGGTYQPTILPTI